jgi:hypothetical protein
MAIWGLIINVAVYGEIGNMASTNEILNLYSAIGRTSGVSDSEIEYWQNSGLSSDALRQQFLGEAAAYKGGGYDDAVQKAKDIVAQYTPTQASQATAQSQAPAVQASSPAIVEEQQQQYITPPISSNDLRTHQIAATYTDPKTGVTVAVGMQGGVPSTFKYFDSNGQLLTTSTFDASQLYKAKERFGFDLAGVSQIGQQLDQQGIRYRPYELYAGTGSDHGLDFNDIAKGGLGTAYDWRYDKNAARKDEFLKGTGAAGYAQNLVRDNTELARRLNLQKTNATPDLGFRDPRATFTSLQGGDGKTKGYAVIANGTASWYDTPEQAAAFAARTGGVVKDLSKVAQMPRANVEPLTQAAQYRPTANFANQVKYNNITQPPAQNRPVDTRPPNIDPRGYTTTGNGVSGGQNPYAQVTQQMNPLDAILVKQAMTARQQAPQPSWVTGVGNWR